MKRKLFQELKVESGGELEITPKLIWCFIHNNLPNIAKPSFKTKFITKGYSPFVRPRHQWWSKHYFWVALGYFATIRLKLSNTGQVLSEKDKLVFIWCI